MGISDKTLFKSYSGILIAILLLAFIGPLLTQYDPTISNLSASLQEPSSLHWFGTDKFGRDYFTRIVYGAKLSITVSLLVVFLITTLGTIVGVVAAYLGGKADIVLMRLTDIMLAFPGIILAIAIAGVLGGSIFNAVLALTIVGWTKYARLARSLTIKIRQQDYISAAVVNGSKNRNILWRHIIPNVIPTVVVSAVMDIGAMMMEIAGLSFLGFGAQAPTPEWGLMLNEGRQFMQTAPWLMVFPGAGFLLVVAAFNLWGDSLRDVMDTNISG